MAVCPKCFSENKAMLAEHCPDCTHKTSIGDQLAFSALVTIGTIIGIFLFFFFLFG